MKLKNQKELDKLQNCPLKNNPKTIKLFRLVKEETITENDLIPLILENPKRFKGKKNECLSWGLSLFNTRKAAEDTVKFLSKKKRKHKSIYSIVAKEPVTFKHQSGTNKNHYTVYPYTDIDLIPNFVKE